MLADSGQAQAGMRELETQLQESKAWRAKAEKAMTILEMDQQVVQAENEQLQEKVADLTMQLSATDKTIAKLRADTAQKQTAQVELVRKVREANADRSKLEAKLNEMAASHSETKQLVATLQSNLLQAETEKQKLQTSLSETEIVQSQRETELNGLKQSQLQTKDMMARLQGDAAHATAEKQKLEARLLETAQLQSAAESVLQEMNASRSSLEERIVKLTAELDAARSQTAPSYSPMDGKPHYPASDRALSEKVSKEIQRVEEMLTNAMKLINDSSIELSLVMRKSNECKELQSYLRGIRFATEVDSTDE
jgi:chromosome segregation ATPase